MSSVTENKILMNVAERLGLREEINVIKKSDELLRVLQTKGTVKRLGDFSRAVLCLDLSCTFSGIGFDKESAILLSGLKKPAYQNSLNMYEKVLELDRPLTIREVCVQFSCTVVKDLSEQILAAYRQHNTIADLSHPQYVAVAVYTACKLKSVKVEKSHFVSISRLKPMQWKELENEFGKFVEKIGLNIAKPKKKSTKNQLHEILEEHAAKIEYTPLSPEKKLSEDIEIEAYETWKTRILAAAKKALLES